MSVEIIVYNCDERNHDGLFLEFISKLFLKAPTSPIPRSFGLQICIPSEAAGPPRPDHGPGDKQMDGELTADAKQRKENDRKSP